ncbi:uncharacterized protein LOC132546604 [Ylistrum balloti]|uniref:uncharacterized protein LOC132546604 n=1 Tax=Ylistrum balloti TaxID=509963 RepID=UPI0029059FA2|nr:uncharacterized protein LOC132546604 [Ylistrum balloti]
MTDKTVIKNSDLLTKCEPERKKSTENLQNELHNGEELQYKELLAQSRLSATNVTELPLADIKNVEKEIADVSTSENLLFFKQQYDQTAHKPREITEIENPLTRHHRNYKVSKRPPTERPPTGFKNGNSGFFGRETSSLRDRISKVDSKLELHVSNSSEMSDKVGRSIPKDTNAEKQHMHPYTVRPTVFTISDQSEMVPEGKSPVDSAIDLDVSAESTSFNDYGDVYMEDLMDGPFDDNAFLDNEVNIPDVHLALELDYLTEFNEDEYWPDEDWLYVRDLDLQLNHMESERDERLRSSPYPRGSLLPTTECEVCFDKTNVRKRLCCDIPICETCMENYVEEKVKNGAVSIQCIGQCESLVHRNEILSLLSVEMKEKYYKFLVDANQDPMVKTCPQCSTIYNMTKEEQRAAKKRAKSLRTNVTCLKCDLVWCFPCHAPEHQGITCKEYLKGDKLLKSWAKIKTRGQDLNAQKCPRCKVFIQRNGGCDHMTCKQCGTSFCYRCGERYIITNDVTRLIGNHHSKFSPLGCKYNLMPNRPCARKLIRGSVLGAKVLGGILLGGLLVAAGVILVGTSFIVFPAYKGFQYHKQRKYRKRIRNFRNIRLQTPELPQLMFTNTQTEGAGSADSSIFGTIFDESDNIDTYDELQERAAEYDPSHEVEVWVHCHHQNIQTDLRQEMLENEDHLENRSNITQTTAKLSKDQDQGDTLYVKTAYVNADHSKSTYKKEIPETHDVSENQKAEESLMNTQIKNDSRNGLSDIKGEASDGSAIKKQQNQSLEKGEDLGDDNSTTQGCFVRIFGKKLPLVWEKDYNDEMMKTLDSKQKDHPDALENGQLQDHSSIMSDTKILPPSVPVDDGGSLDRKKHVSSVKVMRQDIVNRVLQSTQPSQLTVRGSCDNRVFDGNLDEGEVSQIVDPYFGVVSPDNYETTL